MNVLETLVKSLLNTLRGAWVNTRLTGGKEDGTLVRLLRSGVG